MSKRIFNKRFGWSRSGREAHPAPETAVVRTAVPSSSDPLLLISRELSQLARVPVPAAAKARGWAALERELERRPLGAGRVAGVAAAARPRAYRRLVAVGTALVAVLAVVLGTYGEGLWGTTPGGEGPGTAWSVAGSESPTTSSAGAVREVPSPPATPSTTGSEPGPGPTPTSTSPVVTSGNAPAGNGGTVVAPTPSSPAPSVVTPPASATTRPSAPSTTATDTPTTNARPSQPSTTAAQQLASAQRESSARALAVYLADLVITGNTSGARALVEGGAQASLAQMIMRLSQPYGYRVLGTQPLGGDMVRVTLEINDRVVNNVGELVEVTKTFAIRVQVRGDEAVVTAINAG